MMRLAVLGSGSGSNFQSILDAIHAGKLSAQVVCVISDVENAFILERARNAGVPAVYEDCAPFKTKLDGAAEDRVIRRLQDLRTDYVVLAGFMRIIKLGLLRAFPQRMVNIHPSLLPAFPGLQAWKQALEYGAKIAGCTVHLVDEGTDTGPILIQRSVPVMEGDTADSLHARIQVVEHEAYPEALRRLASGKYHIQGRRVVMD